MKPTAANIKLILNALWTLSAKRLARRLTRPKTRGFKETLGALYQVCVKGAIFFSICLVAAQSLMDIFNDKAVFLPFKTPPALDEMGYNGESLVNHIANHMDSIRRDVERNDKENFINISVFDKREDVEIPGAGVSLKEITGFLRSFFGASTRNISGNVAMRNETLYLTVNITGKPAGSFQGNFDGLDDIIRGAAIHILRNLDPFTLGKYYYLKKDHEAMRELTAYIRQSYADYKELTIAYLIDGLFYYSQGRYEEALYEWESAIINDVENANAFLYRGWALDELGRFEDAVSMYQKTAAIDPDNPGAYNSWAIVLYKMGRSKAAIEKFKTVLKIKKDYAKGYNNWGYLLFEFHRYREGIEMIKKAIRFDPKNPHFYESLAEGYLKLGKNQEAIAQIRQAIRLDPENSGAYHIWAEALARLRRYDEAYEKKKKGMEIEKNNHAKKKM